MIPKSLDLPPVWLFLFAIVAYTTGNGATEFMRMSGVALMFAGIILTAVASFELRKQQTTIVPHRVPDAIVTTGVYRFSRNPIYLADAIILAGVSIYAGSVLGVLLVIAFCWVITRRFIVDEEARLTEHFGPAFAEYSKQTRRWL